MQGYAIFEPMVQSSEEIRRAFAARIREALALAGIDEWGAGVRLSHITGKTPKAASKWLNAESMPGRANMKAISDALGVRIEWLNFGEGSPRRDSLDSLSDENADQDRLTPEAVSMISMISIPQYDVRAAMGDGQLPTEYREFVRNIVVNRAEFNDLGLQYSSTANLRVITGWGQSMLGTIEDRAPVLVDIGITAFVEEGVYVFTWLDHMYIKRVQVLDSEHFQLISDNKVYGPQKARMDDVHFHAKVLGAWNFKRL